MEITYEIGDHVKLNFGCQAGAKSWIIKDFYGEENVHLESPRSGRVICTKTSSIIPDFNNANFKAVPFTILTDEEKKYYDYDEDEKAVVRAWLYDHGYSMVKTDTGYDIFHIPTEDYPDDDPRHKDLTLKEAYKRLEKMCEEYKPTVTSTPEIHPVDSEDMGALCESLELLRRDISSLRYTLQDMTNFAMECEKKDRELRDISEKSDEACKDDPAFVPRFKVGENVYQGNGKTRYEILDMRLKSNGPESDFEYLIGGKAHCNHWVDENKLHY